MTGTTDRDYLKTNHLLPGYDPSRPADENTAYSLVLNTPTGPQVIKTFATRAEAEEWVAKVENLIVRCLTEV